jgi:hypothetical protein
LPPRRRPKTALHSGHAEHRIRVVKTLAQAGVEIFDYLHD